MANANSTRAPNKGHNASSVVRPEKISLLPENPDVAEEIFSRIAQVIGIVDLLGNIDRSHDGGIDDDSINSASWAAKDLLVQVRTLVSALQYRADLEGGAV